ncbi:hypothetical protein ACJJTC_001222 [Scirpophaga incertulas]
MRGQHVRIAPGERTSLTHWPPTYLASITPPRSSVHTPDLRIRPSAILIHPHNVIGFVTIYGSVTDTVVPHRYPLHWSRTSGLESGSIRIGERTRDLALLTGPPRKRRRRARCIRRYH